MKMKNAQVVIECLLEQGVDTVFGYPGGTILNIYDALYQYRDRINHILTAHEQGASHAADGYARATGKVGVCFATSGPGATNLTTGIATAYMDSSPVVFITCNVGESLIGKDSFQEVDITGITMPITKSNYLVRNPGELADIMREAFAVAAAGRPGPVLVDIPKNITTVEVDYTPLPKAEHIKHGRLKKLAERASHNVHKIDPDSEDVKKLLGMIAQAKKPMILAGGGIIRSQAEKELLTFAEKIDAPVAMTLMGLGAIPSDHPLSLGLIGMHGTLEANRASTACDLLIALGTRFSDRVAGHTSTFAKNAKIVQVDIDRAEIDKNVVTDYHLIGDACQVLAAVNEKLPQYSHGEWLTQVESMAGEPIPGRSDGKLEPRDIMREIHDRTKGEAIIVTDVGQHQMWAAQYYSYKRPCQLITSGGFGTMGFGLGAALGTKLGKPDATVVHITGDGSFRMNAGELATESFYGIPVITVLMNNGTLGMVRQWQSLMYGNRHSQTTLDRGPDFVKLAGAYGMDAYRVSTGKEFADAFDKAVSSGKSCLIECRIDIDEMVRPMVSAGSPITDFLLE
ncbi:biosynthetic-type acetolactate synthase large subunit [Papillibacter cinnamivorans]|uniref:Acetolactate synthase n=1 Tax=Papillibacter cinnamivorans DSM 12816 TaxID=1122930 RepID=A0A1W2BI53_9FIRM|nr:biosynthetic-type acetolactate synthase large subunit [Papillibacter cinnamivorans]SMC72655.1 acetolactate synthase, large subunit [Papillibacter cinnamivorans DSM 12816]